MLRFGPKYLRPGLRRLLVGVLLLNVIVLTLVGLATWRSYHHHRDLARQSTVNLSRVLEESLSRFIDKVDLTMLEVIDEIQREEQSGGIDRPTLERFLALHDARLPEALGLRVVNAQGIIQYAVSNVSTPNASIADREHFIRHRDDPNMGLFISKPVIGRLTPQPMIILARRRIAPDGSFNGIVHAAIPIKSLTATLSSVDLGPRGNVALWGEAPTLLSRTPRTDGPTSGITPPSSALRALIDANAEPTFYHAALGVDGMERPFYYRRVKSWPLYLTLGMADDDILANWRRDATALVGLAALFLLTTLVAARIIHRHIEALKQAQYSEEDARRHSDLILASAGEGICGVDLSGKVTFINAAARKMLGWTNDEGEGEEFHLASHHHYPDGSPYPTEDCPMHKMLAGGGSNGITRVEEDVYWRRDGTCFPVEYTVTPLIGEDGAIGIVNIFRDITESVRTKKEIAGLLSMLQAVLHNTPIGIAIIGLDRIIIEANHAFCRIYGRHGQVISGQSTNILYGDPDQYENLGRRAYPLVQKGETFQDDVPMIRSDGSQVWVRLVAHLVDVQNPDLGVVWAAEDISARKALELDLKRSNAELEQFAYVASHDLRQPLRMVTSYLGLIERRMGEVLSGDLKEFFDFAQSGAKRMDKLILDLLDYARTGKNTVIESVCLDDTVHDALQNLEPAINEAKARISVMPDLPTVIGDTIELTRLLQNLISNAVKYRAPNHTPVIDIGWSAATGEWVLWVKDNGIGIAPEDHERAFQIFQRLVPKGDYEGSGIGLAVCQKIVAGHNGRIWIESMPGEGTTIFFTLPATA